MLNHYTHRDFIPKSRAVACLRVDVSAIRRTALGADQLRKQLRYASPHDENQPVLAATVATPRGFAQYETSTQVFELVTNEALRDGFALVRLTA
jgi:hypothetical protein